MRGGSCCHQPPPAAPRGGWVHPGQGAPPARAACSAVTSVAPPTPSPLQAIDSLVRVQAELLDYSVNSVTEVRAVAVGGWISPRRRGSGCVGTATAGLPPWPGLAWPARPAQLTCPARARARALTQGIEALANTRVVIRPAGKMAGEG